MNLQQQRREVRLRGLRLLTLAALPSAFFACGCAPETKPAAPANSPTLPANPAPLSSPPNAQATAIETRARLVAATRMNPDDPQAYLRLALFDLSAGDTTGAEKNLRALKQRFPDFAEASFQLGKLYLSSGRNAEAAAILGATAQQAQKRADVQVLAGLAAFRNSRYDAARSYVQRAIRIAPEEASAYLLLARINSNKGTAQQAMEALQNYLKRSKTPGPGYYLMARLYYRKNDFARAESWGQRALATDPNNPDYLAILGHIYCELGGGRKKQEGIALYQKALAIRPQDWETHAALGRIFMQERQWESAVTHLRAAMENAPDAGPLLYSLGQSLIHAGQAEEGKAMLAQYQAYQTYTRESERLKRAIKATPRDRAPRYAFARLCLQYGQHSAALAALQEAEQLLGPDKTLRDLMAQARSAP